MKVITLDKVKELLGISENTYDSAITAAIPFVDSAVKRIMRNNLNYQVVGSTKNGSPYVEIYAIKNYLYGYYMKFHDYDFADFLEEYIEVGQTIRGEGIPSDSYVDELYYNGIAVDLGGEYKDIPTIELNQNATATNDDAQLFLGINIGLQPIIAKAVWWKTLQTDTTIRDDSWISRKMGPVSVTKSEMDAKIDGQYGMPLWLIKALPHYHGGH